MVADMRTQQPRLYQRINVDRNDAWVPKIRRILDQPGDDDALVVVGALHLLGDDGVVGKLRARGYQVERICSACKAGTRLTLHQGAAGTITMQSTGHAGTHSSHPVHSGSMTTCMCLAPPMMASTGQAWMHLVQPMQSASTTTATRGGLCAPRLRS